MLFFSHAKINIGLRVLRKRADGYHDIASVMYPVALHESLEILPTDTFSYTSFGLPIACAPEQNTCYKAYHLLREYVRETKKKELPAVRIIHHKTTPMGMGLGAGSANGAAVLLALNQFFNVEIDEKKLQKLAREIGADTPFFMQSAPCFCEGDGSILQAIHLDLTDFHILLCLPEKITISTAFAYQKVQSREGDFPLDIILQNAPAQWRESIINDFEIPMFESYPYLAKIKNRLYDYGADYVSMTGSGACFFALFARDKLPEKIHIADCTLRILPYPARAFSGV